VFYVDRGDRTAGVRFQRSLLGVAVPAAIIAAVPMGTAFAGLVPLWVGVFVAIAAVGGFAGYELRLLLGIQQRPT
jgi:hypothetical protein